MAAKIFVYVSVLHHTVGQQHQNPRFCSAVKLKQNREGWGGYLEIHQRGKCHKEKVNLR